MVMQNDVKQELESELDYYIKNKIKFSEYYPGMNVLSSNLYKKQLKEILVYIKDKFGDDVSKFEMYLDTIIINMHTKAKKYKKSIYFDNENIKDIQNQGYTIPFFVDEKNNKYILLGILESQTVS